MTSRREDKRPTQSVDRLDVLSCTRPPAKCPCSMCATGGMERGTHPRRDPCPLPRHSGIPGGMAGDQPVAASLVCSPA
jgi:hypothetical protein